MSDFGLGDDIVDEEKRLEALRWHGFLALKERCKMTTKERLSTTGIVDEIMADDGPTGEFREVLEAFIVDAGDNIVESNVRSADEFKRLLARWRGGSLYLIEQELGEVVACAGDEFICGLPYQGQA